MATGIIKTGQIEISIVPTLAVHSVRKQELDDLSLVAAKILRTADVVLVAGTVTVTDALTVAGTKIRLLMKTPGGTVGAAFVSAKTVSTGFVITSTSALDTSTLTYEVYE